MYISAFGHCALSAQCRIVGSLAACGPLPRFVPVPKRVRTHGYPTPGIVVPRIYTEAEVGTQYLHFSQAAFTHETCRTDANGTGRKLDRRGARERFYREPSRDSTTLAAHPMIEKNCWFGVLHRIFHVASSNLNRIACGDGQNHEVRSAVGASGSVRLEPYSKT